MAFFYVKAGGTAAATSDAGRSVSPRTGAWTATTGDYYDTLTDAITSGKPNDITAGDVICWSDASYDVIAGDTTVVLPNGVMLQTVSDAAVDQQSRAVGNQIDNDELDRYDIKVASEADNAAIIHGINLKSGDTPSPLADAGRYVLENSHLEMARNSGGLSLQSYGSQFTSINTDYSWSVTPTGAGLRARYYPNMLILGGELNRGTSTLAILTGHTSSLGMGQFQMDGVKITAGDGSVLYNDYTGVQSRSDVLFSRSTLPIGWTLLNMEAAANGVVKIVSCDNEDQYFQADRYGEIDFVTNVYYTTHEELESGNKGSFEFNTNGNCSRGNPLVVGSLSSVSKAVMAAVNTEAATKKKVRFRLATESGVTIDSGDVFVAASYPRSDITFHSDWLVHHEGLMTPPTALSTETGAWTGSGLGTEYILDIDLGNPANGVVEAFVGICKPDVTVYVSWQLEFVP